VAVVLLLAILPATLHCTLEQSGLLPEAEHCCGSEASGHEGDSGCAENCDTLESKGFRFKKDDLRVSAPVSLSMFGALLIVPSDLHPELVHFNPADRLEHQRPWQFVHRTASLGRLPSVPA